MLDALRTDWMRDVELAATHDAVTGPASEWPTTTEPPRPADEETQVRANALVQSAVFW